MGVNISYSQHSTPLLLYSTLSAVCVSVCVFVCVSLTVPVIPLPIFTPFPLFNSWVSSQTGGWPLSPPFLSSLHTDSSTFKISLHRCGCYEHSTPRPLSYWLSVLFGCFHPSCICDGPGICAEVFNKSLGVIIYSVYLRLCLALSAFAVIEAAGPASTHTCGLEDEFGVKGVDIPSNPPSIL